MSRFTAQASDEPPTCAGKDGECSREVAGSAQTYVFYDLRAGGE